MVDHEGFHWTSSRLQFQPKLSLHSLEDRGAIEGPVFINVKSRLRS